MHFPPCKKAFTTCHYIGTTSRAQKCVLLLHLLDHRCRTLDHLAQIQAHATTSGLLSDPSVAGKLIQSSATTVSHLPHALLLLSHSPTPALTPFTCNSILRSLSTSAAPLCSLPFLSSMLRSRVPTQSFTFAFLLKACARSRALGPGRAAHALSLKTGHAAHLFVANTAINLYSSCRDVTSAHQLFDEIPRPNIVSWNALIAAYARNGMPRPALAAFDRMLRAGLGPDDVTALGVLSACAQLKELELGRRFHEHIVGKSQGESDRNANVSINLGTALIDMYAKCGCLEEARAVFDEMQKRDVGTWNAIIGGCVYNGCFDEALQVFDQMQKRGLVPDETSLVSSLRACTGLGALDVGRMIHLYAEEKGYKLNVTLGTALVDMYSKCGSIDDARLVFDEMEEGRDVVTWTSLITGLASHGHAHDALECFESMRNSGQKPDAIAFLGVLSACSHVGLVSRGLFYFELMRSVYNIEPIVEHYGCLIDLLGRAGQLVEALEYIKSMEIQPNAVVWRSFLSACRLHSNVELAEIAVRNLFELQSDHSGDYILLSNIYSSRGRWDYAQKIRMRMEEGHVRKIPGLSSIELGSKPKIGTGLKHMLSRH